MAGAARVEHHRSDEEMRRRIGLYNRSQAVKRYQMRALAIDNWIANLRLMFSQVREVHIIPWYPARRGGRRQNATVDMVKVDALSSRLAFAMEESSIPQTMALERVLSHSDSAWPSLQVVATRLPLPAVQHHWMA
jgi:hypothetical protein